MALPGIMTDAAKIYGAALPNATRNDMLGAAGLEQFQSDDEKRKREEEEKRRAAGMKKGGVVKSKKARGCGCAQRGLTKGKMR